MPSVPNFKLVTPDERKKLAPLLAHYAKDPHPFTACVRDNRKRFGPRTEQVCAVVKDLIKGTTKWRGKEMSVEQARTVVELAAATGRLAELEEKRPDVVELAAKKIPAKARDKAAGKGQTAYNGSFPIRNVDELRRAIQAYGRAPEDKRATVKAFILRRARALGAMNLIPDSWKRKEMAEADLKAAVELAQERGCTIELKRIELAAPRPGLVQVEVDVRSRKGKMFKRRVWVRPGQARAMAGEKGGRKVTAKGLETERATRSVLEELAKIPKAGRPAGWDTVVKAVAGGPTHGGRLGPAKRKALRELQRNAPEGPLKAAVTAALKADARAPERPMATVKPKAAKRRRRAKAAT